MSRLDDLAERIERLALRHEELRRTNVLLEQQLASVTQERDSLKSRLGAARARIDALLERLPTDPTAPAPAVAARAPRDSRPEFDSTIGAAFGADFGHDGEQAKLR